ncbi:methylmalonyl-CoA epimerase [Catalinimonas niigatensis]|uniref:methylmalonyl-CoA epimerase n=1 Tax=Catalinimonas niigatensis TaxID=1397264 RepID=UPI002664E491|nr:methylmalonyl-CoA epimerase [Catalinimonas niigatensis]WPP52655.1 methylmalonyl-CoA epimerase [Catalinimonas niigatensis]
MMRLEHIGIAVKDDQEASSLFARLLGTAAYKSEKVESEGVNTTFFQLDNTKLELLQSLADDTAIDKFISKRGEGIHHLAFAVDDIIQEIQRLKSAGFTFINETPKAGADNKLICFLHPKSTNGVLVELCQSNEQ